MSGSVTFDPVGFVARYPEFSTVSVPLLTAYFNEATLFLDNTGCSPVTDASAGGVRATLLNMLTAHIASLNGSGVNGAGASPLVGRIANATEGSVSVGTDYATATSDTQAWLNQTKYGAEFYAVTARFRRFRYVPASGYGVGGCGAAAPVSGFGCGVGYGGWGGYGYPWPL